MDEELSEQLAKLETVVKQHMSREALSRLGNIKTAHPQKAVHAILVLGQALQKKKIVHIDDALLKEVLQGLVEKKEIKINKR